MKRILLSLLKIFPVLILISCNVHEWPEEEAARYEFILNLEYDEQIPFYKEVYYSRGKEATRDDFEFYDIRYIVNVYRVANEDDASREIYCTYIFSRYFEIEHDYKVTLNLPEGNYRFRIWTDHVNSGVQEDYFYSTSDFSEIKLKMEDGHKGSNEYRDAFSGTTYGTVIDPELYHQRYGKYPSNKATAHMRRPMGRYEFISTDMDEFLGKTLENLDEQTLRKLMELAASRAKNKNDDTRGDNFWNGLTRDEVAELIGIDKYKVVFAYNAYMPSTYNLYYDRPSDSSTGVRYESSMSVGKDGMQLGFDYILVDDQTIMNLSMSIFNAEGEQIASTSGVQVPIVRSKNTVVKGTFLTVTSGGGVGINPDFDGEYNIEIK
ncbi:MAG: hypothetical protein J1F16_03585 [Muribaculaceae bacterium]|nr:hypothetical protein [Muribaculaceae bacterium]